MEGLIGLIVGVFVLIFVFALVSVILQKLPWLKTVIGFVGGIVAWAYFGKWWIGLLVFFFVTGSLAAIESFGSYKCVHCGSYDTKLIRKSGRYAAWQCNKCGGVTYTN